jgi:hypothetical protein
MRPMALRTAFFARSFGARVRAESQLWILLRGGRGARKSQGLVMLDVGRITKILL